jgi:formylglycine-generating enzyme required for sulfatase activity
VQPAAVHYASFSPDGHRFLACYEQRDYAALWDVQSGRETYRLAGNPGGMRTIRFSPDGRRALSGGRDGTVRLWGLPKPPLESKREATPTTTSGDDAGRRAEPEIENSIRMKLVLVPAGKFQMGSPPEEQDRVGNEDPRHTVEITRAFYMGAYPVTQEEYQKVTGVNPSCFAPGGAGKDKVAGLDTRRFPVEQVSWFDAVAFCEKLSALEREKKAGRTYRLPTEAEWEYACRAGTTTRFSFGERLSAKDANFDATRPYGGVNMVVSYGGGEKGPALGRTAAVGSYPKNPFGLFDMHGNVYQWCNDWHDEDYFKNSPGKDPPGPASGPSGERSFRGGAWPESAWACRAASRSRGGPNSRGAGIGFRVVCVVLADP